ncbi:hypothetical protein BC828DRAFT_400494 [Blastocladiella britannica]|nr:hypothetical protein BC828DRAFT_400494 [Blastocladiella britannica]
MFGHTAANCKSPTHPNCHHPATAITNAKPVGVYTLSAMHSLSPRCAGTLHASVAALSHQCMPTSLPAAMSLPSCACRCCLTHAEALSSVVQQLSDGMVTIIDANDHAGAKQFLVMLCTILRGAEMDQLAVAMTTPTPEPITTMMTTTEQQQPAPWSVPLKHTVTTLSNNKEDSLVRLPAKEHCVNSTTTTITTASGSVSTGQEFPGGSSDQGSSIALVGNAGTVGNQQQCHWLDGSGSVPDANNASSGMSSMPTSAAITKTATTDAAAAENVEEEPELADAMEVNDIDGFCNDDLEAVYGIPDTCQWTTEDLVQLVSMYGHAMLVEDTDGCSSDDSSNYNCGWCNQVRTCMPFNCSIYLARKIKVAAAAARGQDCSSGANCTAGRPMAVIHHGHKKG